MIDVHYWPTPNGKKVTILLEECGLEYKITPVNIQKGDQFNKDFLRMNPMGQVPVVELDDGRHLAQSNAIMRYLAHGSPLLPEDPYLAARVDELLFWEQYSHEPYIAVSRFHMRYLGKPRETREPYRVQRGESALDLMQQLLEGRDWFIGSAMTIADIALLAYTRLAHEGGFDLGSRPNVRAWIGRCEDVLGLGPAQR